MNEEKLFRQWIAEYFTRSGFCAPAEETQDLVSKLWPTVGLAYTTIGDEELDMQINFEARLLPDPDYPDELSLLYCLVYYYDGRQVGIDKYQSYDEFIAENGDCTWDDLYAYFCATFVPDD